MDLEIYAVYRRNANSLGEPAARQYRIIGARRNEDDYFAYIRFYLDMGITADDPLRVSAFNLMNVVNNFILFRKKVWMPMK
jgi:hypothetical protein